MKSSLGFWVGYHFYIAKNGIITQTRAYTDEGAHTKGQNSQSIGICLAGNFDATLPTEAQIKSLTSLLIKVISDLKISPTEIYPHRKFAQKTCYGNRLSDTWARDLINTKNALITPAKIGDNSKNIESIQEILTKGGYVIKPFQKGIYDENMAQTVLYFQLKNNVADIKELASLRGELIGNKTIKCLSSQV